MIKRLTILISFLMGAVVALQAQEAKACFKSMPDSLCPLLSAVNRADFIDFLESKMKAEVTNNFGGKSEMTELTSDYLHVKMTPQSTWQMKLLAVSDTAKVICVVSTACAPACDSHIRFYTTDWAALPVSSYLPVLPTMNDFIAESADSVHTYGYQDACRQADMLLMKADLSAKEATLTFTFTTIDYMNKEAAEKLRPFVRRPVVYTWDGKSFR
ncbi:DUF3256 family protein [uncultured Bacteroides sp.]|uniref:DUF3256 family protein n=1 Tax=uncultured Bacteroides sp. TaxID=162156 RepID=UPI0023C65B5D|nr:DUF3256 family protein [uncultured Bacteroides sp.]MDE5709651.1 DUF3256 family protein [Bacteroides sp.]MDE5760699.1 DUF3256 family protein [Bacteroides sp.]